MAALHRDYVDFDFALRSIRKAQNRPSTRGLSAATMKEYVLATGGESSPEYAEYARQESISKACPNPYMYMRRWFMARYPDWARAVAPAAEAEREEEC
mgnify:FL=1